MEKSAARASAQAVDASLRTVASYEGYARDYAKLIDVVPPADVQCALRRLAAMVPAGGAVLEIGSGTGRDADFLEYMGVAVHRTDATQAFMRMQTARGKQVDRLNLLTDSMGGPHDAVLALCVLIHIDGQHTGMALGKIACALRPAGAFLISVREGEGESRGPFQMTYWSHAGFAAQLEAAGLRVEFSERRVEPDGEVWLTFLGRKAA
jgi:SAM-dependent methyltransferase